MIKVAALISKRHEERSDNNLEKELFDFNGSPNSTTLKKSESEYSDKPGDNKKINIINLEKMKNNEDINSHNNIEKEDQKDEAPYVDDSKNQPKENPSTKEEKNKENRNKKNRKKKKNRNKNKTEEIQEEKDQNKIEDLKEEERENKKEEAKKKEVQRKEEPKIDKKKIQRKKMTQKT